ncbi:hypothetical protein [Deinococcus radiotolerans]|uniref:Uncharacterized protein n=1 Tax=Deinococcus radiotolerans TaxID=1309407 RepID=A0ABQ2FQG6_9DEIO|nr:hypothetical protein [Deinococcus radiotolerans]GGL16901.1 hypothetical protein GCM10010844_39780 [Deinococcus radiotolerans]
MTLTVASPARRLLLGAALMLAALGVTGTGRALQLCPECISVQLSDPCLGC